MNSWDIWNKGVLLSKAHFRVASPEQLELLKQYEKQTSASSMLQRLQQNLENGKSAANMFENVTGPTGLQQEIERSLRAKLLAYINSGELLAYGIALPRRPDDEPIPVPPDLWAGVVSWHNSRLHANGLRMEQVKLVKASPNTLAATKTPAVTESPEEPTRPAGRPSRKDQIIEAFHALTDSGKIDFYKPASHCYPAIRKWVKEHYPNDADPERGLGDKALEKHFNPLFMARRKALSRD